MVENVHTGLNFNQTSVILETENAETEFFMWL